MDEQEGNQTLVKLDHSKGSYGVKDIMSEELWITLYARSYQQPNKTLREILPH
ncbi:MAG: hypothetical protein O4861_09125 [Trichodesmium sp. St16_bin4-tuft]|uniref:hypothetical protein n=1 Tax=Trichodesmium erythraeum TaxID=1206 RepID=UPI00003C9E97|nr:hypothetical protein [Trichodesmium erythraeum GBRTRLIN201]MCH2048347.1 hypothetical protein [Trichodesmium sp. ALOHA_ZT_67]MCL2928388.1 hypothetical protein [Trichodesmium sp. MAG_R01]MDE5069126.1 hypothetical protein [Trichodesmium sp. St4_bin8_1]MDE5077446.1 hypothetical protein [Trichodesmium sp. St2_bin6]MDE5091713.1 hypothetical protein [Trichodesmium sp. St18_bin3_1_1]MDE5095510.1 hypothetical protein [Trichodesmium sp. St11_bin5]MDE5098486.1 hypothetical protein [Trichodesmium sp.